MKYTSMRLFFLTFFFSCMGSGLVANNVSTRECHQKFYVNNDDIAIDGSILYVQCNNAWMEAAALRRDEEGLYVYRGDLKVCGSRVQPIPKKWKCPYCNHWWELGERCQNADCPTNQWKNREESP